MCRTCRHSALDYEIENYAKRNAEIAGSSGPLAHCPLCHTPILMTKTLPKNLPPSNK